MTSRKRSEEVREAWTDHFSSPNAEGVPSDDGQKVECSICYEDKVKSKHKVIRMNHAFNLTRWEEHCSHWSLK